MVHTITIVRTSDKFIQANTHPNMISELRVFHPVGTGVFSIFILDDKCLRKLQ